MKNFKQYYSLYLDILEEGKGKANTHLTHLEELILTKGQGGYDQAKGFLTNLLGHLQGKSKRKIGTTVKWDGAPAIFVGKHPDNGKFFVGTKSIFNKEPKINYNDQDVDINHGHAPGLADKLKKALKYLPKLGIKNIMQGDFMFDSSSVKKENIDGVTHYTFQPNTIKYAVEANSDLGKQIANAVFGIIFHTEYSDLDSPAAFGAKVNRLNKVPGVWFDDAYFKDDTGVVTLTDDEVKQVKDLIKTADSIKVNYKDIPADLLNTYINTEIREGKFLNDPEESFRNFIEWYNIRINKEIEKRKSVAGKQRLEETLKQKTAQFEDQKGDIINLFKVSSLLSQAKQIFINKYNNAVYNTKHFIDEGEGVLRVTSPEGYVAVDRDGSAIKLVNRLDFSSANFQKDKPGS